jgi:hypothetical protein
MNGETCDKAWRSPGLEPFPKTGTALSRWARPPLLFDLFAFFVVDFIRVGLKLLDYGITLCVAV